MGVSAPVSVTAQASSRHNSGFTWLLVFLLLGSTTINFIDRQSLSVLAPVLREEFRLSNSDYARILNAFMIAYTIMYGVGGVFGFGGTGSSLGTVLATWAVGLMLDRLGNYTMVFVCIGALLPVAFIVGGSIVGRIQPLEIRQQEG